MFLGILLKGAVMEYVHVTKDNLEEEHICCAISNNKDVQVSSKKAWLSERFDEGLVFLKSVERGKCFIEYIPAENAWIPIEADGYMYIDCLWVSGAFKGHGYSTDLLTACIEDSKEKGKKGLCILCASKKAWLSERFDEGLVFLKSVERGKCFIEYIPAENAWIPIEADGYMYIDCLWVSWAFKGHGYSTDLLTACIEDSNRL